MPSDHSSFERRRQDDTQKPIELSSHDMQDCSRVSSRRRSHRTHTRSRGFRKVSRDIWNFRAGKCVYCPGSCGDDELVSSTSIPIEEIFFRNFEIFIFSSSSTLLYLVYHFFWAKYSTCLCSPSEMRVVCLSVIPVRPATPSTKQCLRMKMSRHEFQLVENEQAWVPTCGKWPQEHNYPT